MTFYAPEGPFIFVFEQHDTCQFQELKKKKKIVSLIRVFFVKGEYGTDGLVVTS